MCTKCGHILRVKQIYLSNRIPWNNDTSERSWLSSEQEWLNEYSMSARPDNSVILASFSRCARSTHSHNGAIKSPRDKPSVCFSNVSSAWHEVTESPKRSLNSCSDAPGLMLPTVLWMVSSEIWPFDAKLQLWSMFTVLLISPEPNFCNNWSETVDILTFSVSAIVCKVRRLCSRGIGANLNFVQRLWTAGMIFDE